MIRHFLLCVMCMTLLAACDTGGGAIGQVNSGANPAPYRPIDLETMTETASGMILSGALDHNTGWVDAYAIPIDRGQLSYRNLEVETRNGYLLRIVYRTGISSGTYPINTPLDTPPADDTNLSAGLLYLWSPDPAQQFTVNPQGTVTLDFVGEDIFGEFNLSLENPAGEVVTIVGQVYTQQGLLPVQ